MNYLYDPLRYKADSIEAASDRASDHGASRGRRRPRGNRGGKGKPSSQAPVPDQSQSFEPSAPAAENIPPTSFSFADKISLALRGSNWQELQTSSAVTNESSSVTPVNDGGINLDVDIPQDDMEDILMPPQMTSKQKKTKARFDERVARDAGDYLQSIPLESIVPIAQNVSWDQEPELVCSYNWQASTDDTNTIFGESSFPNLPLRE